MFGYIKRFKSRRVIKRSKKLYWKIVIAFLENPNSDPKHVKEFIVDVYSVIGGAISEVQR